MAREFVVRYLKRAAILVPLAAILIFLPPGDWIAKLAGVIAILLVLLVAQLAELALVLRNASRADAASDHDDVDAAPGTRRRYRSTGTARSVDRPGE